MRLAVVALCLTIWTEARPAAASELVTIDDLLILVEASVAEDVILLYAEVNGVDPLSAEDLERLENRGASEALIVALEEIAGSGTEGAPVDRVASTIHRGEIALATPAVSESEAWSDPLFLPTESYSGSYTGGGFGYGDNPFYFNPFSFSYAYPYYGGYSYGAHSYARPHSLYSYRHYPYDPFFFLGVGRSAFFGHSGRGSLSHGFGNIHRSPVHHGERVFFPRPVGRHGPAAGRSFESHAPSQHQRGTSRLASPARRHESPLVALASRNRRAIARRANGASAGGHRADRPDGRRSTARAHGSLMSRHRVEAGHQRGLISSPHRSVSRLSIQNRSGRASNRHGGAALSGRGGRARSHRISGHFSHPSLGVRGHGVRGHGPTSAGGHRGGRSHGAQAGGHGGHGGHR